mmetsp:Transcript_20481/g.27669  ORF Transcript_20481/g.27669 Transcript_20481/m.27669 type:complete len:155 (-) Transcript_20481:621-1085(-)
MTRQQNCLEVYGNFSWGFTSLQAKKDAKAAKKEEAKKAKNKVDQAGQEEAPVETKQLKKFITLRDVRLSIKKGEFISIIGDVGSGKSSLLQAIIGDLIYVPQSEIDEFGGLEHEATQEELDTLRKRLLTPDFKVSNKPIKIRGSVSYVEQGSWI